MSPQHPTMRLSEIAAVTGGRLVGADSQAVMRVTADSREVTPGGIFAAFAGENTDGHRFVAAALGAGAAVALVDDPDACGGAEPLVVVPDVRRAMGLLAAAHVQALKKTGNLTVIAVTGSAGKTTTKDLLAAVLPGPTIAAERSFNNEIGMPVTALRAGPGTRFLVLEMGADKAGDLTYLTNFVPPDVAIVLMVGTAHLAGFGSRQAVAHAKAELIQALPPGGIAVLNGDDPNVAAMAGHAPGKVVTFGVEQAEVRASDIDISKDGKASFTLSFGGKTAPVRLGIVGRHHVTNALGAAAAALSQGVPLEHVAAQLAAPAASPHRMAVVLRADGVQVVDDSYNANPDSMAAALQALATLGRRRTIAVLGGMRELGEAEREEHRKVGRLARQRGIDVVISVGPEAAPITQGAPGEQWRHAQSVEEADQILQGLAQPGDTVLFKASNGIGLWKLAERWTR